MTTRRIVRFASEETGLVDVILRCYCGTEVSAEANPPQAADSPPQPVTQPAPQAVPAARPVLVSCASAAC